MEHRHLLGLGRDHDVTGAEAGRDRGRDLADVALGRRPDVVAPQDRDDRERDEPGAARGGQPCGAQQQEGRHGDRHVAHRPRRGDLRGPVGEQHGRDAHERDRQDGAARGRQLPAVSRPQERDHAPARSDHEHEPRRVAEQPVRRLDRDVLVLGLARPRRTGVRGLEEQRRQPRQVQQRGQAEAERAVAQPPAALGRRRQRQQREPGDAHRQHRGRAPSCGCRAWWRARARTGRASAAPAARRRCRCAGTATSRAC